MKVNNACNSRSDLMSLLTEACELEHGLACSYLYSAFTLRQSAFESDNDKNVNPLSSMQFQAIRRWAGQLYFIASQEMMHLSQVWNLLTAIGGTPYYMRPNFPQGHKYYPVDLPLKLEPFSKKALKRFTFYELPSQVSDTDFLKKEFNISKDKLKKAFTVGELYTQIRECFDTIPEHLLFIGNKELQVGPDVCHFNEIVKVVDRKTANSAIETIMEQGEGNSNDQLDCHYGLFVKMDLEFDELEKQAKNKNAFVPSRRTIQNPITSIQKDKGPAGANPITDPYTNEVAVLFDNIYSLMLRILQYVFQSGPLPGQMQTTLSDVAIQIMTRVLKPIGEALTLLPAGKEYKHLTAGPAFGLYRHVSLPANFPAALTIIKERSAELISTGRALCDKQAPTALKQGIEKLEDIMSLPALDFIP
jgi:Ferritin-like